MCEVAATALGKVLASRDVAGLPGRTEVDAALLEPDLAELLADLFGLVDRDRQVAEFFAELAVRLRGPDAQHALCAGHGCACPPSPSTAASRPKGVRRLLCAAWRNRRLRSRGPTGPLASSASID